MLVPLNGKQNNFPGWEIKKLEKLVMSNLARVPSMNFLSKLSESESIELKPSFERNKELIKHRKHNVMVFSAITLTQKSKYVIITLQELKEPTTTFPSSVMCNTWKEIKHTFRSGDSLSVM